MIKLVRVTVGCKRAMSAQHSIQDISNQDNLSRHS